ncbi:MAG: hypothetical protein ABR949_13980 [Candidatus Aquilonibacter sp.]|jgi:hypothetical protein
MMQSEPTPTDLVNAIVDLSNATVAGMSQLKSEFKPSIEGEVGGISHWINNSWP